MILYNILSRKLQKCQNSIENQKYDLNEEWKKLKIY